MKVLVTGAMGFTGRQLVPQLLAAGHTLRALVRTPQDIPGVESISGALPDATLCRTLCAGMDAVVHLAAVAHVNASTELLKTCNLDATLELARAAKAQGVRKFVFMSSSKARYPGHSAYARYKAAAETELRKLHEAKVFEVVCLRPALIYGRGMQGNLRGLLRLLARPFLPVFVASNNSLGLISVQDVSRAVVVALATDTLPDQVWELADGTHYTLTGLVRDVRATLGLAPPALVLPRPLFWLLAALASRLTPVLKTSLSLSTYNALFAEHYRHDLQFSLHTGFAPQDSLRARLTELLENMQ